MKRRHQKWSEITRTGSSPTCYGVGGEEDWSSQHFLSSHNLPVNSWFSFIVFFISVYFMTIAFIMILITRIHDDFLQNSGTSLAVSPSASLLDTSSRSLRTPTTSLNSETMMQKRWWWFHRSEFYFSFEVNARPRHLPVLQRGLQGEASWSPNFMISCFWYLD